MDKDIAAWVSYDMAKRSSKEGDKFGTGVVEGLIAAEAGNNACVAGAMVLLASTAMFILGLSLVRTMVKVLLVSSEKLMPIVFTLCVVGAFAIQQRIFDVGVMVVFGIIGYYVREMDYPVAPLVLGIILEKILDDNLRRALTLSDGSIIPFFTRPICAVIAIITLRICRGRLRGPLSLRAPESFGCLRHRAGRGLLQAGGEQTGVCR